MKVNFIIEGSGLLKYIGIGMEYNNILFAGWRRYDEQ